MGKTTIYIRDEDEEFFKKARKKLGKRRVRFDFNFSFKRKASR